MLQNYTKVLQLSNVKSLYLKIFKILSSCKYFQHTLIWLFINSFQHTFQF